MFKQNMNRRYKKTNNKILGINFLSISLFVIIIFSIFIYYSNNVNHEKILRDYCGDFGLYGKYLTLYENNSFIYSYHGCSQSYGYTYGTWEIEGDSLKLFPNKKDITLNETFSIVEEKLTPLNSDSIEFILCDSYFEKWNKN